MERNFDIRTSLFRLPQGTSPQDPENITTVERIMKAATGAESVKVAMHHGPNGAALTDLYNISLEFPGFLEDGQYLAYRKKGALQGEAGNLLANIIRSLSQGADAKADIQKLLSVVGQGDAESIDGEEPLGGGAGAAGKPGAPAATGPGSGGSGGFGTKGLGQPTGNPGAPGASGFPGAPEKKKPFAGKSKLSRAMFMENKLNVPLREGLKFAREIKTNNFESFVYRTAAIQAELECDVRDAIDIVKLVDTSTSWKDFHTKAAKILLDPETNKPLEAKDYVEIAKIARGEAPAPLV